ncbi:IS5 family transposase [Kutzneria sp. CA-103260]|nr:IS5 family transposase [Kutzneria sp. CA-103260]
MRIARKDVESGEGLGRHQWVVERTIAWLYGYRRIAVRYERKPTPYCAFLVLAMALTCFKRLTKATT